ncbi:protein translocase subunit SecD [Nonomuraea recticatena]|uniref:Protein translocase subunit SecD n=1 Tax=Nonomuraea recticatena TaxID=46178 RepID=A0ABP6FKA4_9ACTN
MARPTSGQSKPGRTLLVLLALILAMGGAMFLQPAFTPKLGLDLAGGTTATLSPVTPNGTPPSEESLNLAVNIIRERVNGTGISDAEVAKSGDNIVISVPGAGKDEVIKLVGTTAELRFRQVLAAEAAQPQPSTMPTQAPTPSTGPSGQPSGSPSAAPSVQPSAKVPAPSASPTGKALSSALTSPNPAPSATTQGQSEQKANDPKANDAKGNDAKNNDGKNNDAKGNDPKGNDAKATPSATPSAQPSGDPAADPALAGIDPALIKQFNELDCAKNSGQGVQDDPSKPYVTCDQDGTAKYILDKAEVVGADIDTASAGVQQTTGQWVVQLNFKSAGASAWSALTTKAYQAQAPRNMVAVVLDGVVITAPNINEPIPGGRAEISGSFTQETATKLADQLKYGALPLKFVRSSIDTISSTLGNDQLMGGLISGAIGLGLVVLYSLLYYRGLGLVAVLSLVVASIITYEAVVLLGTYAGFGLSLPHIIGLVVSIGITADSFIVYFERIRDEMKEGRRTLRAAVEVAWVRARRTILIADAVMFIAAIVLYFLAVGGVAGFAFAMGLTTLIDVLVVFMFTKPFIALLARMKFFAKGHKLSGLDAERMGPDTVRTTTPQEA